MQWFLDPLIDHYDISYLCLTMQRPRLCRKSYALFFLLFIFFFFLKEKCLLIDICQPCSQCATLISVVVWLFYCRNGLKPMRVSVCWTLCTRPLMRLVYFIAIAGVTKWHFADDSLWHRWWSYQIAKYIVMFQILKLIH